MWMLGILLLASALISYAATKRSISLALCLGKLDTPNPRSSHSELVPRLGGLGIVTGFYLGLAGLGMIIRNQLFQQGLASREIVVLLVVAGGMALTGLYDDFFRPGPGTKLGMQLFWGAVAVGFGLRLKPVLVDGAHSSGVEILSIVTALLWLVGCANVYNFMDGINGLAGGTGILYGCFFLIFSRGAGDPELAALSSLVAGSCAGFLALNFPRARTFMGDVGSVFLGSLFALFVMRLSSRPSQPVPLLALLLVCSVFIYDAAFTLARRVRRRENIFQAHCEHLYQRLAQAGLSHAQVATLYWSLQAVMGSLGLIYCWSSPVVRKETLALSLLILLALPWSVHRIEQRVRNKKPTRTEGSHRLRRDEAERIGPLPEQSSSPLPPARRGAKI